jgi:hypothetical protein
MRRWKRCFRGIGILVIVSAAFIGSCGGGGGGGVDVTPPETNLTYILGPPRAPVGPLTATGTRSRFILSSNPPALELPLISGTFDTATLDTTIADNAAVPILWADTATEKGQPLFGNLAVAVGQLFRWNGAGDPTAGEFLIRSRDGAFPGGIRAQVTSQAGSAGVLAEYDSGDDGTYEQGTFFPWGTFHDLWADDAAPLFQRVSSFVFYSRHTIFSLMDLSLQSTNAVEDLRAALQVAGSDNAVRVDCDALPGAPNQPGFYSVVWTDVNGNGQIDYDLSGANQWDTFTFTIHQCWNNDPANSEDLLLDGVIRLTYYEPHVQWGSAFDNLVVTRTSNNVVLTDSALSFTGGFSMLIPGY